MNAKLQAGNDGGVANGQLKLRMVGNRTNASALAMKVGLDAGVFHVLRTADRLSIKIGVGQRTKPDAVTVRYTTVMAADVGR